MRHLSCHYDAMLVGLVGPLAVVRIQPF
jgi:hypothetical protein